MSLPRGRSTPKKDLKKAKPTRKNASSKPPIVSMTAPSSCGNMLAPHAPRPHRTWKSRHGKSHVVVVLDLDHTLVDSDGFKTSHPERRYVLDIGNETIKGSLRPNWKEFLQYLEDGGADEVVIWTAGLKEYADAIVDVIYGEGKRPNLVWHRDHCAYNADEKYYHKPLQQLADELKYDKSAILMIDDRNCTFVTNPHNGLLIPPYEGSNDDDALGQIVDWMELPSTRYSWSVTQLPKEGVFVGK